MKDTGLSLASRPASHRYKSNVRARQRRSGSLKSRLLGETNAVRGAPRRRRPRTRGLWMRSTSDNARNVEALCSLALRPTAPFSRPFRLPRTPCAARSAAAHLSSKLATASGALRVDERCAGVLRRDGSSNTSQYAVLHVEWQTGIHASNLRERSGRGRSNVVDGGRVGDGVEVSSALHDTLLYTLSYARSRPSVVVRERAVLADPAFVVRP